MSDGLANGNSANARPKGRRLRPAWTLKPASRAAYARGCRCSYIDMAMQISGQHGNNCPLTQQKADFERSQQETRTDA